MTTILFDSNAFQAAVAAGARAVAAQAEKLDIAMTPKQCESVAVSVISHHQAFTAGVDYATAQAQTSAPHRDE
ncbi:hypothetical protein [Phytohabitans suffuscus]|nr:hypothetical protein [Phytohabitans suffuscus]